MSTSESRLGTDLVGTLSEVCHAPFDEAWAKVGKQIPETFGAAIETAVTEHQDMLERAGLLADPPADAGERSELLVGYRREVGAQLLYLLLQSLERRPPAEVLGKAMKSAEASVLKGIRRLPEARVLPWTEDAFASDTSDSFGRGLAKGVARILGSGKAGTGRSVPIRALTSEHVVKDLLPAQCASARSLLGHTSNWMTALESAFAAWSDKALPVLMSAEKIIEMEDGTPDTAWATVAEAAQALQAALSDISAAAGAVDLANEGASALGAVRGALASEVRIAGGFVYSPTQTSRLARSKEMDALLDRASAWDAQVVARLKLHESLLSVLSGGNSVQGRLVGRLRAACVTPSERLVQIATHFDGFAEEAEEAARSSDTGAALEAVAERAAAAVEEAMTAVPVGTDVEDVVRAGADSMVESLQGMIRQVPGTLVLHAVGAPPPTARGPIETRSIPLQEMARQAFDALRMERIRTATYGVTSALQKVCEDAAELPGVVAFGFEAAREELEKDEEGAREQAAGLAREALQRTAEAMRTVPAAFEQALNDGRAGVAEEIAEGCEALFERAGARRMQAQLLAAQSRFSDMRLNLNEAMGPYVDRALRLGKLQWTRLVRVGSRVRRQLLSTFGAEPVAQAKSSRTIRTLAAAKADGAPLVYQRLFSLDAIWDPTLLAGRDAQLSEVLSRWSRWQSGDGIPTLVVGRPGVGVTSFVNVVMERLRLDDVPVAQIDLDHRVSGETELVEIIANALDVTEVGTFDELAKVVLRAPKNTLPQAVSLDTLEHVYLRSPGGTDLLERFLTFMSETEPQVFWVGGITTSAWQLIRKSQPAAVTQVEGLDLEPLTPADLREAVMRRHRRSGLQVRFEEPAEGRQLLRRRLRRVRGTQAHRELLEADFFERLHRASLGTLRLSLYQWLLAADFETGDSEVRMSSMERPDFSVLDQLDLTQNFTLKAFLEHRTLTLSEHDAVFRVPRQESYQIFESLGNRHLIEHINKAEGGRAQSEIVEGLRYQVKPLLTGAVIAHLERRNIIH